MGANSRLGAYSNKYGIHFLCLCPLRLAIMINFNISNVGYCHSPNDEATNVYMLNPFF